jgi:2-oxo-4-hydroxy-4-carboxy--5-ureidoimidazoline (OHCU) decarboxylase
MKQTAVEWYAEQSMLLELKRAKGNISITQMLNELSNILEQAKEMEKEQIIKAYEYTAAGTSHYGEQYYNETYNK